MQGRSLSVLTVIGARPSVSSTSLPIRGKIERSAGIIYNLVRRRASHPDPCRSRWPVLELNARALGHLPSEPDLDFAASIRLVLDLLRRADGSLRRSMD